MSSPGPWCWLHCVPTLLARAALTPLPLPRSDASPASILLPDRPAPPETLPGSAVQRGLRGAPLTPHRSFPCGHLGSLVVFAYAPSTEPRGTGVCLCRLRNAGPAHGGTR